jgi:cytochrome b
MIVPLLIGLAGTSLTGMAQHAAEAGRGPLAPWYGAGAAEPVRAAPEPEAREPEEREEDGVRRGDADRGEAFETEEEGEDVFEEAHEVFANLTLALVVVHMLGVLYASWLHRENLVMAMVTGRKRPEREAPGPR